MFERGEKEPHQVVRPLPRSVEMVESALEVGNNNDDDINGSYFHLLMLSIVYELTRS